METERISAIRIHAPEWFERADFQAMLTDAHINHMATWHSVGYSPTDYSDVFVTVDGVEGSDSDKFPEDIWEEIVNIVLEAGMRFGLVWISPV
jgi:hypothetical protein